MRHSTGPPIQINPSHRLNVLAAQTFLTEHNTTGRHERAGGRTDGQEGQRPVYLTLPYHVVPQVFSNLQFVQVIALRSSRLKRNSFEFGRCVCLPESAVQGGQAGQIAICRAGWVIRAGCIYTCVLYSRTRTRYEI